VTTSEAWTPNCRELPFQPASISRVYSTLSGTINPSRDKAINYHKITETQRTNWPRENRKLSTASSLKPLCANGLDFSCWWSKWRPLLHGTGLLCKSTWGSIFTSVRPDKAWSSVRRLRHDILGGTETTCYRLFNYT
jgi:hypothetical protein